MTLQKNDIMCRIGTTWYRLDEIGPVGNNEIPIIVSDDDGQDWEYELGDIEEIDPIFDVLQDINNQGINTGVFTDGDLKRLSHKLENFHSLKTLFLDFGKLSN